MRSTLPRAILIAAVLSTIPACGGPSLEARENRKTFEMLLTAISLKNQKELERDARRIEERHASGVLSNARYRELVNMIAKARAGGWGEAEEMAYAFRGAYPYFE